MPVASGDITTVPGISFTTGISMGVGISIGAGISGNVPGGGGPVGPQALKFNLASNSMYLALISVGGL